MYDVPWMSAGKVHLARNTPITMLSEITTGERPSVTSLVGASAAPSHAPAVRPQNIPTFCSVRSRDASIRTGAGVAGRTGSAVTRSSAVRRVQPRARQPEPRIADPVIPDLATFSDLRCDCRSRPAPERGRRAILRRAGVVAQERHLETTLEMRSSDGQGTRMALDPGVVTQLGAGAFVAGERVARISLRVARQTTARLRALRLGAAGTHQDHPA